MKIISVKDRSVQIAADVIPSVNRVDAINELCDARIFTADVHTDKPELTLSKVAINNRDRFPNMYV